jgi:hypothetical protein
MRSRLIADATGGHLSLDCAPLCDRELSAASAAMLRQIGDLLAGQDGAMASPDAGEMERRQEASVACHRSLEPGGDDDSVKSPRGAPVPKPSPPGAAAGTQPGRRPARRSPPSPHCR